MHLRRIALVSMGLCIAGLAYVLLDFWSAHNAPLFLRFERQWREDVQALEASGKLPKEWFDVRDVQLIGGTPETRTLLRKVVSPLKSNANGQHRLEALIVLWEEEGVLGVLIQYNLEELKSKNNIWELGRTLILSQPNAKKTWKALGEELFSSF